MKKAISFLVISLVLQIFELLVVLNPRFSSFPRSVVLIIHATNLPVFWDLTSQILIAAGMAWVSESVFIWVVPCSCAWLPDLHIPSRAVCDRGQPSPGRLLIHR
jgi:hypothetical protein